MCVVPIMFASKSALYYVPINISIYIHTTMYIYNEFESHVVPVRGVLSAEYLCSSLWCGMCSSISMYFYASQLPIIHISILLCIAIGPIYFITYYLPTPPNYIYFFFSYLHASM